MARDQREWFRGFVRRSCERATDQEHTGSRIGGVEPVRFYAKAWAEDIASQGLAQALGYTLQLTFDPDGKEEFRGWSSHYTSITELFLQGAADVDLILKSFLETTDYETWKLYPGWFGHNEHVDHRRARAARFRPHFTSKFDWLPTLLDDQVPIIRHIAAIHIVKDWPNNVDERTFRRLREAADDPQWIWSWSEEFSSGATGAEKAQELLKACPTPWLEAK
jgi:hypothetical protein